MLALQHLSLLTPPVLSCDYTSGTGICAHHPAGSSGCLIPLPVTQLLGECHLTATRTADSLAAGPHRPYEALTIFHKTPIALPTYSAYCREGPCCRKWDSYAWQGCAGRWSNPCCISAPLCCSSRRSAPADRAQRRGWWQHHTAFAWAWSLNCCCWQFECCLPVIKRNVLYGRPDKWGINQGFIVSS